MKKFSRQEIREDRVRLENDDNYTVESSPMYKAWRELADDMLNDPANDYPLNGFKGFSERSVETLILDFDLGGRLADPLSVEEMLEMISVKETRSLKES